MLGAQDTVIGTPELLGLTLSYLPVRDLLVAAPLASKMWQATILTTVLQRPLLRAGSILDFPVPPESPPRGNLPALLYI
jgi:hypothetical protein